MNRSQFLERARRSALLLDGSYGATLNMIKPECRAVEMLNITDPELVSSLQEGYVQAGVDILLTNTFSANAFKLRMLGLEEYIEKINQTAVQIARRASQGKTMVFGDISSTGHFAQPLGEPTMEALIQVFQEQARHLMESGVDGFSLETFSDIKELKAAIMGVRSVCPDLPLIAHMTFDEHGRSVTGNPVQAFGALMNDLDVDVMGINCTLGPQQITKVVEGLLEVSEKPICLQPNAGKPISDGVKTRYDLTPEQFRVYMEDSLDLGVSMIGGCCGTNPDHIRQLRLLLDIYPKTEKIRAQPPLHLLTARTRWASIDPFLIVGERINPASRKTFQNEIQQMDYTTVIQEAVSQQHEGAHVLDINLGIEKTLTPDHIRKAIHELDLSSSLPLSIDIQTRHFREIALMESPGRSLINSAKVTPKSLEFAVRCLRTYGGMVVLLGMGKSVPETAQERFDLIVQGIKELEAAGISRERVLADPLVMTIGAGHDPKITLKALELLGNQGIRTTLGLSNLSYGMPRRSQINAAFLSQGVSRGLSSAIMNPAEKTVMQVLEGSLTLEGKELVPKIDQIEDPLILHLLQGDRITSDHLIQQHLETTSALDIGQKVLGKALQQIGDLYAEGKIYLPHLLMAAQTAAPIFERLNAMAGASVHYLGRVLLATVEGDVHDIGKKIVGTVLQSGGFEVIDIGKDIHADEIFRAVRASKPDIVGLSAMMTTTIGRVEEFSQLMKKERLSIPLICGGASLNERLALSFGCDGYCVDASGVVALCQRLMAQKKEDSIDRD